VAIGSALVVPMVEGGYEAREVRRAARQIASTMHYCRGEAVALGQPQELVIDALENSIHTTGWGRWAVLTDRAVIEDVQGGQAFGDGVVQILFFPNGSTSGARALDGPPGVLVSRSSRSRSRSRSSGWGSSPASRSSARASACSSEPAVRPVPYWRPARPWTH